MRPTRASTKPKHHAGYTPRHAQVCEQTLVLLLRGLGPYRKGMYLVGGLVPRYLIPGPVGPTGPQPSGTTDVDLVLDLRLLATVEAYRTLEQNLKALGFERGRNEEGNVQHHSWRKPIDPKVTVVVDLLRDAPLGEGGQVERLPDERRVAALKVPGAHLAVRDHVEVPVTVELPDDRGTATETVRVAGIVPFLVLKALAYEDRFEQKDAHDIVYVLWHYGSGPADVAREFADRLARWPDEPLLGRAIDILRRCFATDEKTPGYRKDGPASYAGFWADPGQPDEFARRRREAAGVVESFLQELDRLLGAGQESDAPSARE